MPVRMTTWPNVDQYVAVSTTTRPVTQTALVVVNSAVSGSVNCPPAEDTGSMSNSEMVRMIRKKPSAIIACALMGASLLTRSRMAFPPNIRYNHDFSFEGKSAIL